MPTVEVVWWRTWRIVLVMRTSPRVAATTLLTPATERASDHRSCPWARWAPRHRRPDGPFGRGGCSCSPPVMNVLVDPLVIDGLERRQGGVVERADIGRLGVGASLRRRPCARYHHADTRLVDHPT